MNFQKNPFTGSVYSYPVSDYFFIFYLNSNLDFYSQGGFVYFNLNHFVTTDAVQPIPQIQKFVNGVMSIISNYALINNNNYSHIRIMESDISDLRNEDYIKIIYNAMGEKIKDRTVIDFPIIKTLSAVPSGASDMSFFIGSSELKISTLTPSNFLASIKTALSNTVWRLCDGSLVTEQQSFFRDRNLPNLLSDIITNPNNVSEILEYPTYLRFSDLRNSKQKNVGVSTLANHGHTTDSQSHNHNVKLFTYEVDAFDRGPVVYSVDGSGSIMLDAGDHSHTFSSTVNANGSGYTGVRPVFDPAFLYVLPIVNIFPVVLDF